MTRASELGSKRQYYGGVPSAIEVTDHVFVDADLCNWFIAEFAFPQYVLFHFRIHLLLMTGSEHRPSVSPESTIWQ